MNRAVFLDRDGVINFERGDFTYRPDDFRIHPELIEFLKPLRDRGFLLIVVTNQSGISKGIYTLGDVDVLHRMLEAHLSRAGIALEEIYICTHHPEVTRCICRKPDSGQLEKAIARFDIDPTKSFFIGDRDRDTLAAAKVNIRSIQIEANTALLPLLPSILSL